MKNTMIFSALFFFATTVAAQNGQAGTSTTKGNRIAYFYEDSVIRTMPEYKSAMDSLKNFQAQLDSEYSHAEDELENKVKTLAKADSLKMQRLVVNIKIQEVKEIADRLATFRYQAGISINELQMKLLEPLAKKIDSTAEVIARQKGCIAVIIAADPYLSDYDNRPRNLYLTFDDFYASKDYPEPFEWADNYRALSWISPKVISVNITGEIIRVLQSSAQVSPH